MYEKNYFVIDTPVCGSDWRSVCPGIRFHEGSFDEALVRAKQEKKLIFIDFYTEWCGPCKWMSMNVFNRSDVGDFFNKNFVCCKIDAEKEGKRLAVKYKVQAYRHYFFWIQKAK